jgi:hypothetical protein
MGRRKDRFEGVIRSVGPKLWAELIAIIAKIIGQTVSDKLLRFVLLGALGAAGSYVTDVIETPPPIPLPVPVVQSVTQSKAPE